MSELKGGKIIDYSQYVYYDESSPSFLRWRVDVMIGRNYKTCKCKVGDVVGSINRNGYYLTQINRVNLSCHRVIYEIKYGVKLNDSDFIDHIDGNRQNNNYKNLRVVNRELNSRNCKIGKNNSTGVTGVFFKRNAAGNTYAVANWTVDNKVCNKYFSVDKLGIMVAFREAAIHRKTVISQLNQRGLGYSPRHGT